MQQVSTPFAAPAASPKAVPGARTYIVRRSRLEGEVRLSGAKNSVLRLMAASLLTPETIILGNYPAGLLDAVVHEDMLRALGKTCAREGDTLVISEKGRLSNELVWSERSIRNTLLILGALTARLGCGSVPYPGGCRIGERNFDLHVTVLNALGARVHETETQLVAEAPHGLIGAPIYLPIRSTGATENAILCASLAKGKSTIWGPHIRPEIIDLTRFMNRLGARITVYGQERIEIEGVAALEGGRHRIMPDSMEALTWLIGATITGGTVEIVDFPYRDLEAPLIFLKESGAKLFRGDNSLIAVGSSCFPVEIATGPYPGINSDMQPLFALWGAMSAGESRIIDLRFPGRYAYARELEKLGAKATVEDNLLKISGGGLLRGTDVWAADLRAGVALALAGTVAEGETRIRDAWQIERGYDDFTGKLRSLGGDIELSADDHLPG